MITTICVCVSNAQVKYTATITGYGGNCNSVSDGGVNTGLLWIRVVESRVNHANTTEYPDCATCEQIRSALTGALSSYGCIVYVTTTPCTPCGGVNGFGNSIISEEPSVIGLSQGTSFFSSNPANEIQDWAEDNEELLRILGGEETHRSEIVMENGYVFSAHMPGTIDRFIKTDELARTDALGTGSGAHVPDDLLNGNRPFQSLGPWDWQSDDLNRIRVNMEPIDLSDLLPLLVAEQLKRDKEIVLGDIDDIADICKEVANILMSSRIGILPGAMLDVAINLYAENIKAGYLGFKGEIIDATDIFINTLDKSASEIIGDWGSDRVNDGVVQLGSTGVFGIPVSEQHSNAGISGIGKVLSIGSVGGSIKRIYQRHTNDYEY